jgi:hypothetical protein
VLSSRGDDGGHLELLSLFFVINKDVPYFALSELLNLFLSDLVAEFIPKTWHIWDKWRIFFYFIFTLYTYLIFFKRDKLLSKKIKSKYENIKLK